MRAAEVKDRLKANARAFVSHMFPDGRFERREFVVGSLRGEPGDSLQIAIAGPKAGVWCDFATGEKGGSLLELYVQAHRVSIAEAIKACAEWLAEKPATPPRKIPSSSPHSVLRQVKHTVSAQD